MKVWDYLVMPLKGFFRGIHSYRFFNALLKSNDAKVLKMIKTRRNLFNLEEVHTGLSPLHVLIRENKEDLLKEFFARKEVKNYVNSQENTLKWAPIHFAANIGSVPILEQISTKTSNFSIKTLEGTSAIHIASGKGNQSFLAKLLELGVHVDEKDLNDWTALHYSASQNFLEISEFLISKGAKTSLCDKNHLTPLMAAILHGSTESVKFLYKFVDGHKSLSPLKLIHFACSLSTPEVLEWLHLQGEDLWQFDNSVSKNSALHYAALGKSGACIKYLVKKGLPVNIADSQGNTALHIAAIEQDAEIVKVLCQNHGKVTIQNDSGLTPIDIAESLRNSSLRLLLQRYKSE